MDTETDPRFAKLEEKIDLIYLSSEKTRKYFQWTLIITVIAFVLPLVVALFAVPAFLSSYTSQFNSLIQ